MTEESTMGLAEGTVAAQGDVEAGIEPRPGAETAPILLLGRPSERRSATARWLRARGREVYEVGTPLEAISVLQEGPEDFSALFVVGSIAGVSSILIAEALAEAFPALRVVPG
jgi:hypothetical protein